MSRASLPPDFVLILILAVVIVAAAFIFGGIGFWVLIAGAW